MDFLVPNTISVESFVLQYINFKMSEGKKTETVAVKKEPETKNDEYPSLNQLIREATVNHRDTYTRNLHCVNCSGCRVHKDVGFMEICTSTYFNAYNQDCVGKFVDEYKLY